MLAKPQIQHYKNQGFLLFKDQLFEKDDLNELTGIFEEHLAQKGEKLSDELDTPHFRDQRLFRFLMHKRVLDLVEDILGPDFGLWSSHFISKEPKKGRRTPWHEDSAYWKGKFDRLDKIVTLWLAIDDSTLENGCMGVIPASHVDGFSDYVQITDTSKNTFTEEIKEGSFDEDQVVWFELGRGECSLHDARIIHGARANTSEKRRTGYTMRYFGLDMKFNPETAPDHKIYHCRGNNIAGNPLVYL
jgi:ectoine hydroxylase-related dioxygenase (phytanoyl-CoA dioxygenase family)